MDKQKSYTIGELSDICGISTQTLRFYDQKGLLAPSGRDTENNYRLYSNDKALEALVIRGMRQLGMELTELRKVKRNRDLQEVKQKLEEKIHCLQQDIADVQRQLDFTRNTFEILESSIDEVENYGDRNIFFNYLKPETVISIRYQSSVSASKIFWRRYAELIQLVEKLNLTIQGPFSAVFHDNYENQFINDIGDLEVFFPVKNTNISSPNIKIVAPALVISTIHYGNYTDLLEVYDALVNFAEKEGYSICGPSLEEYLIDFSLGLNEEHWVTKVSLPVKKAILDDNFLV
ncbi:MerR family transcriptional regulator [Vagococcus elongatus]|uniref:HTH merR-type domain-containing protein n=1 Tax=Vagococcus elongatus TaxID=180344 RepID=A0A430B587_9ENTE|nr:MerR family transcriptional regulator [Vagococcus elongatus]RSU15520.1 hypothetical protein CBF29_00120 [Vagococcus elongatus]